jgi:hypothetical protein
MRNPKLLIWLAALIAIAFDAAFVTSHALAHPPFARIGYTCIPAPSGDPVKPKGHHLSGAQFVSELA